MRTESIMHVRITVRITPPLNVTETEINEGLEIFEAAVTEAEAKLLMANS